LKKKIRKVLIANRGEIAVRVIRTCHELGMEAVAVYSEVDRTELPVLLADEAYPLGPPPARESYLAMDKIIEVARKAQCDAIHPGYGFLAENPEFARRVAQAGLIFIGPPPEVMELMGDKTRARAAMQKAGVPVVPGSLAPLHDLEEAKKTADSLGYPLLIKAAGGGGGKGMRLVRSAEELGPALERARSEALSAFGDERVYLERFLEEPHHIEVQILADNYGHVIHLGERECSIQRRYQKIIEESPSPVVDDTLRQKLTAAAVRAAQGCNYRGAGTVEFLLDRAGHFYFLEMNTRLQVEHPVTEMRTGLDLVAWQLHIAAGEPLELSQESINFQGHAIECRIYAEDPQQNFAPSIGEIRFLHLPSGPGTRFDGGIHSGSVITPYYDPLLGKLITWSQSRLEALARMDRALKELQIAGVVTSSAFCREVIQHPQFQAGRYSTSFLADHQELFQTLQQVDQLALLGAGALAALQAKNGSTSEIQKETVNTISPWVLAARKGDWD